MEQFGQLSLDPFAFPSIGPQVRPLNSARPSTIVRPLQDQSPNWPNIKKSLLEGVTVSVDSSLIWTEEWSGTWKEMVDRILPNLPELEDRLAFSTSDGGILLTELRDKHGDKTMTDFHWGNWSDVTFQLDATNPEGFFSFLARPGPDYLIAMAEDAVRDIFPSSLLSKQSESCQNFRERMEESMNFYYSDWQRNIAQIRN
jgi:hypothetical protein